MNRELYIHTLSQFRDECERKHMDTETEAFNAAIQALSADGDCISRQAAIDAIQSIGRLATLPDNDAVIRMSAVEYVLFNMPSAQPEPQWIPCSETENLPEHEVLCCDRYGEELIGWLSYKDDQWLCESEGEMMYDPIAWREKPEPWRGEK